MSWVIDKDGSSVRLHISAPVGDWEAILDTLKGHLSKGVSAVYLPAAIVGASSVDSELLVGLTRLVRQMGVVVFPLLMP